MRRSKNASPNLTLLAWKSCSYPRRSGARVRQAWHLPPAAGGPRPAVPLSVSVSGPCAAGASAPGAALGGAGANKIALHVGQAAKHGDHQTPGAGFGPLKRSRVGSV